MSVFLSGQVALVTGGAQGIGWAIAQALADFGAQVYVCDISDENLALVKEQAAQLPWGDRLFFTHCDVAEREEVNQWVEGVYGENGRIDILINNAAYVHWEPAATMPIAAVEKMIRVGYMGTVYATRATLRFMEPAAKGHIVNIGSIAGQLFVQNASSAYCAMKAAVEAYTQVLQMELRHSPIHVTLIRPSAVAGTDFFRKNVSSELMPRIGDWIPYITPPKVAHAVVRTLRRKRRIVNVPGYLPLLNMMYVIWPSALRWLMRWGGHGRSDYGSVSWQYQPTNQK